MPADHERILGNKTTPKQIVGDALDTASASVSYTYTEPTIYFELALDTARLAAAKDAVDKAFELDPDLPYAHGALGWYYFKGVQDSDRALEEFLIFRDREPSNAVMQLCVALMQEVKGKWGEAEESYQVMLELNPYHATGIREYASLLWYLRRYSEADSLLDRARLEVVGSSIGAQEPREEAHDGLQLQRGARFLQIYGS